MEETLDNREPVSLDSTSEQEKRSDSPSPRGVLEVPVSGSSESDNTVALSSPEKLSAQRALFGESNGPQWRNLIDNFKWKSVRKFSTIPLLGVYDSSRKNLMNKLGSNRSAEEEIDYGDLIVPKPSWRNFTRAELVAATNNYSPDKLLGVGGHAEVYKGCLRDGEVVAVKRITKKEKNEKDRAGDFLSELGIIAHINHPNAAKLIGYSTEDGLHLVLKFSPNGSLASALHGAGECLAWNKRFKVAVGIADGLQYLHHECPRRVIHRDITASNILLTHDYEPQISDFGLAKWLPEKWVQHVVNPIEGTFGYMAPEYFMHGIVDEKTDVFAFGVLLLELITGRRAVDSYRNSLVAWAKSMLENEQVEELVDPRLGEDYDLSEMKRVMFVVLACIHHSPSTRPNMTQVVKILKGQCAQTEMRHESFGRRHIIVDSCELEGYTSMNYLSDLNRHMQLVME